jgi:hypothetical protein
VDLYVRKGEPVGDTGFSNPFIADYASQGGTPHEKVYVGPNSNLPLAAGTYYIGVSNCAASSSFTLTTSVITPASPVQIEELAVDNGNPEDYVNPNAETSFPPIGPDGLIVVNRLTPSHYPSQLTDIRIYCDIAGYDQRGNPIDPTGQSIRLVAFSDLSGSGAPTAAPVFKVDQVVTIPGVSSFFDISIANPPVIQSGDWYVGVQQPASFNGFLVWLNESGVPKQAGFISSNGGATFTGPYLQPNTSPSPAQWNANFLIRGVAQSESLSSGMVTLQVPAPGTSAVSTNAASSQVRVGYGVASTTAGNPPAGTAVISYAQDGIVLTEVGVPSSPPTTHAHVYVDTTGQHNTGLAIANPSGAALNISLTAFQTDGTTRAGSGSVPLVPLGHAAAFAGQFISGLPSGFTGVLDISAPQPFVALTVRSLQNSRGDFLLTTMPVAELNQTPASVLVFPQIVDSGG